MRQTEPSSTGGGRATVAFLDREPLDLAARYQEVRRFTEKLCEPLETEDYVIQSMPDVSPTKWHLAHTSWFFEAFLLSPHVTGYRPFHPQFGFLFNSYYETLGARHPRRPVVLLRVQGSGSGGIPR